MKHSFILQGKKFISAKRASRAYSYASDYLGQLCREAKLEARRVGHSWFISEESLRMHSEAARLDESKPVSPDQFVTGPVAQEMKTVEGRISTKDAALLTGYASDYIGQLSRSGKLDAKMIGNSWFVSEASLRAHVAKIALEEKQREEKALAEKAAALAAAESKKEELVLLPTIAAKPISRFTASAKKSEKNLVEKRSYVPALAFAAVIIVAVGLIYANGIRIPNWLMNSTGDSKPAAVALIPTDDRSATSAVGLAIAPVTGQAVQDDRLKQAIKDSFSDEVAISPDASGDAGVIRPVFKKTNGKDFLYVMVPVKGATSTRSATSTVVNATARINSSAN